MRNPRRHPRAGDVVEIIPGWIRTVIGVEDSLVQFNAVNESGVFNNCLKHIDAWRKETKKAKVIREVPNVEN